ncbi:DUF4303 domain-containing protein [Lentzea sp. NBRC 102530]|uniref:DUF4303 domain-containing protein n=1 Tax=Lentzea sp. NBRC 102530 TaxID=3032201 RepID=UPI0024A0086C|nr:DUF4303 domain-containing protein [Lentzea sp. NBRC 102530]GLY47721.1 hypothetical protein Lesp01_13770 [Lentzea sp. NBRC 102530]
MTASFDWAEFERALHDGVVRSVEAAVHPGERFYAAALHRVHREQDGLIALPLLGVNSVEALAREPEEVREQLRWSAPDWDRHLDDWLPPGSAERWEQALTALACAGTTRHWQRTFDRYVTTLVRVCRRARTTLRRDGVTDRKFVVLLLDDELHEPLIKRVLTGAEVRRHFPELDERTVALAELAALPPADRAARLTGLLGTFEGPVGSENAAALLLELGPAAFSALLDLLGGSADRAWQAAKLLADIGRPTDSVITALEATLAHAGARHWAAVALSRLGRLDLVLARADSLPADVVAGAVAAPYTSFRDHGVVSAPLDYRPLAEVAERKPAYLAAVEARLAPGTGCCEITTAEVDVAVLGLGSPHALIRRHAVSVLGRRQLGRQVGRRVLPLLCRVMRDDPDASVRRLAVLSLLWWRRDSRHLAEVVREAVGDPDAAVREAAEHWLREQQVGEP